MKSKSIFRTETLKKNRTHGTVRKSLNVPVGAYFDHTHYLIDLSTSEAVQLVFIKWCETGDSETFQEDMQQLRDIYGTDYLKKIPFATEEEMLEEERKRDEIRWDKKRLQF